MESDQNMQHTFALSWRTSSRCANMDIIWALQHGSCWKWSAKAAFRHGAHAGGKLPVERLQSRGVVVAEHDGGGREEQEGVALFFGLQGAACPSRLCAGTY